MVNVDLAIQSPSLQINVGQGGPIQQSGMGDIDFIKYRDKAGGGTVANSPVRLNAIVPNALLLVKDVPAFTIYYDLTLGSLTSIYYRIDYGSQDFTFYKEANLEYNNGGTSYIHTLHENNYITSMDGAYCFTVRCPNAYWARFWVGSVGTVTGSSLGIFIARGWALGNQLVSLDA